MWFGTMSSTIPMPASRTASASAENAPSPPSSREIDDGSTTS